ncbi:hypothetical protein EJ08DRAFT_578369 [Tothia fuscella]|uniref:Zn(2)-C6 fungal-type domain-containing protein n=1 Tax=Tothia fuscella TaxID=1048955 RepID=A0A9P4U482_9PEZI|nr:hypothetical protein EJ08DRAFT_578369 [Tothia fuscella]
MYGFWTAPFPPDQYTSTWPGEETINTNPSKSHSPGTLSEILDADIASVSNSSYGGISPSQQTPYSREEKPTDCSSQIPSRPRGKPIPRKGHTKSRKGCFSCKRRKIKCQETRPCCTNCKKAEISCEYPKPGPFQNQSQQQQQPKESNIISLPSPRPSLQSTPTIFSMTDMKLFHHFLSHAYPTLPVGADAIWTLQMPSFAHEYEYLMRSMLALSASNLSLTTPHSRDLRNQAITHRVKAVRLLNQALCRPSTSREEGDARFAAFMNLTFQSTCMEDGLIDFLTMLRGCILQGDLGETSAFAGFVNDKDRTLGSMIERFEVADTLDVEVEALNEAAKSLLKLEELCTTDVERLYHGHLTDMVQNGYASPRQAYACFVQVYNFVGNITHSQFQSFIQPTNSCAQLLLSHFIASHVLLRNVITFESMERDTSAMYAILVGWCKSIDDGLDPFLRKFNRWPVEYVMEVAPRGMGAVQVEGVNFIRGRRVEGDNRSFGGGGYVVEKFFNN